MRKSIVIRRLSFGTLVKLTFIGVYGFYLAFLVVMLPIGLLRGEPLIKVGGEALPIFRSIGALILVFFIFLPILCFLGGLITAAIQWVGLWCYSKLWPLRITFYSSPDNPSEYNGRPIE